ncbi:MAG: CRTAC1 family protein, partial [Planctomycetota bacterium]
RAIRAGENRQAVHHFLIAARGQTLNHLLMPQLATALSSIDQPEMAEIVADAADAEQERHLACDSFARVERPAQKIGLRIAECLNQLGKRRLAQQWARASLQFQDVPDPNAMKRAIAVRDQPGKSTGLSDTQIENWIQQFPRPDAIPPLSDASSISPGAQASDSDNPNSQLPFYWRDAGQEMGLRFQYDHGDPQGRMGRWMHQITGGGIGIADFDRNGWNDVFCTQAGGWPHRIAPPPKSADQASQTESDQSDRSDALLLNHAGTFSTADASGISDSDFGQGVAAGDVNEDGFPDLLVGNLGTNRLWLNNGDGTFSPSTRWRAANNEHWTTSTAIADLNADGLSDMVCINYCQSKPSLSTICHDGEDQVTACGPNYLPALPDQFWFSRGDGTFKNEPADIQGLGRGLGILIADLDQEPGVELFVANDMSANHLWKRANTKQSHDKDDNNTIYLDEEWSRWKQIAGLRGLAVSDRGTSQACMGIAFGDPDGDLDTDLVVTNFSKEHNNYYVQQAGGLFVDRSVAADIYTPSLPMLGFGTVMFDFDADGAEDLFVANGLVHKNHNAEEPFRQPAQTFRWTSGRWAISNTTGSNPSATDYLATPHVGRALAKGDLNGDGLVDLVVGHLGEPTTALLCQPITEASQDGPSIAKRMLQIQLIGSRSSRDAVGTKINLKTNQRNRLIQKVAGDGYQSTHAAEISIALAPGEEIKNLQLDWPSGHQQTINVQPGNGYVVIENGEVSRLR